MEEEKKQFLDAYLDEAGEMVQQLNDRIIAYEDSRDEDDLNELFRSAHTLKSSSGSMGFSKIQDLAHSMEDVFDALRDGDIEPSEELFDLVYASVDRIEDMVDHVREEEEEPDADIADLLQALDQAEQGDDIDFQPETVADEPEKVKKVQEIKVDVDRLDRLMNAVGELLITEKKLQQILQPYESDELESAMTQLQRLGDDIQHEVSRARMIPVSQVFDRFPRVVRDLSRRLDKDVDFEIRGGDLRLDRTILDYIGEPLIHMLRNAVDHGIEPPEERETAGKPRDGQIVLEARREKNEAVISVKDDGRGIDARKIRDIGIERGIIDEEEAEEMSDDEIYDLLFHPDFSEQEEVTQTSGRGVGMSVVKSTAEQLHGSYEIESEPGEGTTVSMQLPLSLAVVRSFLIKAGGRNFAIPINSIVRCIRLSPDDIKTMQEREVFIYEDEEIPLLRLEEELEMELEQEEDDGQITVVVVRKGSQRAGLVVDRITDVQEFVIKDLGIGKPKGVSGAFILPDGKPAVVLDVSTLLG